MSSAGTIFSICYVDKETPTDAIETSNTDVVMYGDNDRQLDEVEYYVNGKMRGVTITFQPAKDTNASQHTLSEAIINKFIRSNDATNDDNGGKFNTDTIKLPTSPLSDQKYYKAGGPNYANYGTLKTMCAGSNTANHYLYNRVRSVIGDTVELTSQTYRNSEYTVFIRIGSTGGNQADAQDAIKVYGQWNGTNLMAG